MAEQTERDFFADPPAPRPRVASDPPFGSVLEAQRIELAALREARLLIKELRRAHHTVALTDTDGTIGIRVSPAPPPDIAAQLRASKAALVAVLKAQAP